MTNTADLGLILNAQSQNIFFIFDKTHKKQIKK